MAAEYMINSGGGHVSKRGKKIYTSQFELKKFHRKYLENFLHGSNFPFKTGDHFDDRIGMCNFSILGKNYSEIQRKKYIAWDMVSGERKNICSKFNNKMEGKAVARIAGQTGIDISDSSTSKKNALKYLNEPDTSVFFGDQTQKGGNDYPLARNLDHVHQVNDWRETYELLLEYSQSAP
jgi:hydroxymethylpyrimidine pyrophosphatase-like HAD family hydrolase